jgi:hypothetical protein
MIFIAFPTVICIGSKIDGTWRMEGSGKGFFQHYGMLTIFLATPLLVALSAIALQKFLEALGSLEKYSVGGKVPPELEEMVLKHVQSLSLRTKWGTILIVFSIVGLLFGVANILQTINPIQTYGNDVFDGYSYSLGFYLTKTYLCAIWIVAYPAALFVVLHITVSMVCILRYMCSQKLLRIDFFHPDNCGGVSAFGVINILIMGAYACLFAIMGALQVTHSRNDYATIVIPLLMVSLVFVAQSFGAVYYIHRFAAVKKKESLDIINGFLNTEMQSLFVTKQFSPGLIYARNHLLGIRTYPYAKLSTLLVNGFRFVPALAAIAKLVIDGHKP